MSETVLTGVLDQLAHVGLRVLAPDDREEAGPAAPGPSRAPVVVVGGMATTEPALAVLRDGLERAGHPVRTLTTDAGLGCAGAAVDEVVATARAAADEAGEPVGLVGHSRGGQFVRAAARRDPDVVAAVVTLGTPRSPLGVTAAALAVAGGLTALGTLGVPGLATAACLTGECCRGFRRELSVPWREAPDDVPLTAVRARHDVVVPTVGTPEPRAREVVVEGGHLGLLVSPAARRAVLAALDGGATPPAPTAVLVLQPEL